MESGPADAQHTVLLLPGGMCSARAGAPPPDDYSVEHYARITAELARSAGADVVVGFSMDAVVAYEMVVSRAFTGPVVLLGVSLSAPDEPGFCARPACPRGSCTRRRATAR